MAVESQLERSMLERKDRDELHRIANAMGGKPGSRARKAEIVDLILELAGVGDQDGSPAEEASPKKKAAKQGSAKAGGAQKAGASDSGRANNSKAKQDQASGGAVATGDAKDEAKDEAKGEARGEARSAATPSDDGPGQEEGGPEQPAASAESDATAPDKQGAQSQSENGSGEGETGNRRRRRRGRNRDRDQQGHGADEQVQGEPVEVSGLLDLRDEGYGFLRLNGYLPSKEDVYVSVKQVRQFGLRKGDHIKGASRPAGRSEKNPALLRIDEVNGDDPELGRSRPRFEDLTPLHPDERLTLELPDQPQKMTPRIVDLIAPIGKGQRGLIVSPPKAGKTTVMMDIATSIETNDPDVHLMVLLVDERPEEVTAMRRHVKGEVVASTFDRPAEEHTMVAELALERAKRIVEDGGDVVIILDGITRLARAYNLSAPASGRVMSGGIDTAALYPPKKFFGAARNIEEGGSLTILATALIETGSKMDEVIFEEFKGTGNMELRLDRRLAERRIYPAIDVDASSTRHEELLFDSVALKQVWKLRRVLHGLAGDNGSSGAGLEMLIDRLSGFPTNDEFLKEIAKA